MQEDSTITRCISDRDQAFSLRDRFGGPVLPSGSRPAATPSASVSGGGSAGRRRGSAALGLSTSTNLHGTLSHAARFYVGGDLVECKPVPSASGGDNPAWQPVRSRGDRAAITRFTSKSRSSLKRLFASLNKQVTSRALMVTLTYRENMTDAPRSKKHLHAFSEALRREFPAGGYIWKMECQERGSIHFHLLVFGIRYLAWQWVADTWCRIVAPGDEVQRQAGTQVRAAKNMWEAKSYLNKYLGKTDQTGDLENPGRWWGGHNLEAFKAPVVEVPLSLHQVTSLARTMDKLHRARVLSEYRASSTLRRLNNRWILRWAKRRKSWAWAHTTRWTYDAANVLPRLLDYVIGSPPCQPFQPQLGGIT